MRRDFAGYALTGDTRHELARPAGCSKSTSLEGLRALPGGAERKVRAQMQYQAYKDWCKKNGHRPTSSNRAAQEWARLGFEKFGSMGRNYWRGICLNEPDE